MNWFYVEQGNQAGPVDDAQLEELARQGRIQPSTLVWREGMPDWVPYDVAKSGSSPPTAAPGAQPGPVGMALPICAECRQPFPAEEMIRHGNDYVCAACKPIFIQRLAEGAPATGTVAAQLKFASVLLRFAAAFLDGVILGVINMLLGVLVGVGALAAVAGQPSAAVGVQVALFALQTAIALAYDVFMVGKYGATLDKMACKIKVVTASGGPVSYARAAGRYFAKILSAMVCLIGYIIAFFDAEKRALHDHICNTRVVLK